MNKPRNHHFVSQVHLKNFFNTVDGKIYIYDKQKKNHYSLTSTRRMFSEIDSNTRLKDGVKDYDALERELNERFEKDFSKHYAVVAKFVNDKNVTDEFTEAITYLAKYGIVGEFRAPRHKKDVDRAIFGALSEILSNGTPEVQKELDELLSFKKEIKYSNLVGYSELANEILQKMGRLVLRITVPISDDDFFFVPDCCSATRRAKINEYFNPDIEEVAYINLALSSKIYIEILSSKLQNLKLQSEIVFADSKLVSVLNNANLFYCESKVACENETYLKQYIETNTQIIK